MEVITRAPLRVSFAGGGTDIEPYVSEYGGAVISGAIQFYAQALYPSEPVIPSEMEQVVMSHFNLEKVVKLSNGANQMGGLGGSSACFVAGIKAIAPDINNDKLAKLAFHLERNVMKVAGGIQDQYSAAYGGLNYITFEQKVTIKPIPIFEKFEKALLIVDMGNRKCQGGDVIKDQLSRKNDANYKAQKDFAREMYKCLLNGDIENFGYFLRLAWWSKLRFSPLVANDDIKNFYSDCLKNGAAGGKLCGAGGGGYMLLMESNGGGLRKYLREKNVNYHNIKFDTEGAQCVKKI